MRIRKASKSRVSQVHAAGHRYPGNDPFVRWRSDSKPWWLESIKRLRRQHVQSMGDERILGSGRFVEQALADDELGQERKTLRQQQGWTVSALVDRVCKAYGVHAQDLEKKARANNLSIAKSLICYWGTDEFGLTMLEIGLKMGMSQQAISKWVKKGRNYCRSENIDIDSLLR